MGLSEEEIKKLQKENRAMRIVNNELVKILAERIDEIGYLKSDIKVYEAIVKE